MEFILEEFGKYKNLILKKTERTEAEFKRFMKIIKERIQLVPYKEFEFLMDEAEEFSPDPKDTEYLALALKLNCAVWSNDKKLKSQNKVKIYSTGELINKLLK